MQPHLCWQVCISLTYLAHQRCKEFCWGRSEQYGPGWEGEVELRGEELGEVARRRLAGSRPDHTDAVAAGENSQHSQQEKHTIMAAKAVVPAGARPSASRCSQSR